MLDDILAAIGLMLVFEGMLPFLNPCQWRQMMANMTQLDDRVLRIAGLVSMLIGVAVFYVIRFMEQ